MASPLLFIPEKVALAEVDKSATSGGKFVRIVKDWLSLIRQIVKRLNEASIMAFIYYPPFTAFTAADFTSDSGTWEVDVTDLVEWSFARIGNLLFLSFELDTTTVTGTPSELRAAIPFGLIANRYMSNPCILSDNGVYAPGKVRVELLDTYLRFTRADGAAFTASTNNTNVLGQIWIEVQ